MDFSWSPKVQRRKYMSSCRYLYTRRKKLFLCRSPCTTLLMMFPDGFGDGDWRLSSEGEPAISADATPQDYPCGLFGAAEEAGVSGLCCQGSGPKWLPRSPQTKVTCSHLSVWNTQVWKKKKGLWSLSLLYSRAFSSPAALLVEHGTGNIWALHLLR